MILGAASCVLGLVVLDETVVGVALIGWGAIMPVIAVPARGALMSAVPETQRGEASG